jgi:ATP-dependent Clp protease ATP-binding subunit ClpA
MWYHERGKKFVFERFTEKAIKVIMLAQEEARRLGHNFVGTEQILLGLIGEGTSIAANTLKSAGLRLKDARVEVERIIGRGSGFVAVEIPFTPRAKRLLELSWDEARKLEHTYIGAEHLLLALIRQADGVGYEVLTILGADPSSLKESVFQEIEKGQKKPIPPIARIIAPEAELPSTDVVVQLLNSLMTIMRSARTLAINAGQTKIADMLNRYDSELSDEINKIRSSSQKKATAKSPKGDAPKNYFENFDEPSIKVITLAQEEARRLGHNFVGTEQILLGLLGEGTGVAFVALNAAGVKLKDARTEVEKIIGRGSGFVAVEIPFTPRSKRVLEFSREAAKDLGHENIGTEHLLLGLTKELEGVAVRVLEKLGVDIERLRSDVVKDSRKKDE